MPYLDLPGVNLWYNDTGSRTGTPVIFMHAASGTCDCWVHQVPVFMQAGYRCIAYDRRNWGRSRPTSTGGQPGYVSDDLHGLVVHLNLDRLHIVATAAGGAGGLDYALVHPERVRSWLSPVASAVCRTLPTLKCREGFGRQRSKDCRSTCVSWEPLTVELTRREPNVGWRSSALAVLRAPLWRPRSCVNR